MFSQQSAIKIDVVSEAKSTAKAVTWIPALALPPLCFMSHSRSPWFCLSGWTKVGSWEPKRPDAPDAGRSSKLEIPQEMVVEKWWFKCYLTAFNNRKGNHGKTGELGDLIWYHPI